MKKDYLEKVAEFIQAHGPFFTYAGWGAWLNSTFSSFEPGARDIIKQIMSEKPCCSACGSHHPFSFVRVIDSHNQVHFIGKECEISLQKHHALVYPKYNL